MATRGGAVVLVDGSVDKIAVGSAQVEIQGVTQMVPVYIYKETSIGLATFEAAGFRVNRITRALEKVPGRLL